MGALIVALSLPFLWIFNHSFALPAPSVSGIVILGGSVVICFALAGALGHVVGQSHGNPLLAWVLSLILGGIVASGAASLYVSSLADEITCETAMMAWDERDKIVGAAREARNVPLRETAQKWSKSGLERSFFLFKNGLARSSAFILLFWTVLGAPIGAINEAKLARR